MTKIIEDIALDFDDVRIKPCLTNLSSRKEVNLEVEYRTISGNYIRGVPIISANMSSISTFKMAQALTHHNMFCALHKHYEAHEIVNFFKNNPLSYNKTFITFGMNDSDKLKNLHNLGYPPFLINLDAANGYMTKFQEFVARIRDF